MTVARYSDIGKVQPSPRSPPIPCNVIEIELEILKSIANFESYRIKTRRVEYHTSSKPRILPRSDPE